MQDRVDWDSLQGSLSREPAATAALLEAYRQLHGLPLRFLFDSTAPEPMRRGVRTSEDEMGCSGRQVVAFIRNIPIRHPVLSASWVYEVDSAGEVLQRWPLPIDVEYGEVVKGVSGNELVTDFDVSTRGVFMRVRPSGEFRISAEPPPSLPPEDWIPLPDSNWVRVRPNDGMTAHAASTHAVEPGRWRPRGDSGWYVRIDSGPNLGDSARAVPSPIGAMPHNLACPASPQFEGMLCRGFPDGTRERRIVMPTPCT